VIVEGSSRSERQVGREELEEFVEGIFGEEIHAKRVASLIDGVDGVLHAATLGIRAIGQGLAVAQGLVPKHAIKQVDRLLSNAKLGIESIFRCWVSFVLAERAEIFVNFDWTELEDSDQSLVVLGMQTGHGRSTPLVWKTITRSLLKAQRNDHEDELLGLLAVVLPEGLRVTVVADRGFADRKLFVFLKEELGFDYLIRLRANFYVEAEGGEVRKAAEWVGRKGRMRVLRNALVTAQRADVPVIICVQEPAMKDAWCLASSRADLPGSEIKGAYGRRFTVEETFRDVKNPRLGLGLKQTVITRNDRRDMLFLLAVLAHSLLTLLGKAGQELGMERMLGATRPGQLSLFRQGLLLYELLPRMREARLRALLTRFGELLRQHVLFTGILGIL
jgi:DDE family transposase